MSPVESYWCLLLASGQPARPAGHRADGYTKFQLKVGGDPADDIERIHAAADVLTDGEVLVADANTGWRVDDALRVVNAVRDRDVYIEQPCRSYEHCLTVRRKTPLPFILDENITGIEALMRGHNDGAMDVINLKISKFSATDFNSYVTVRNATGAPQRVDGRMQASGEPGLGIEPDMDALGEPVAVYAT